MMNSHEVNRSEKKFLLSYSMAAWCASLFRTTLTEDTHNNSPSGNGYIVRSLYFDSIFDDDFDSKADGLEHRRKIRLRIYPPDFKLVKLEMKEKNGAFQRKRDLTVTPETACALISGDYSPLLNDFDSGFSKELYRIMHLELYVPRCIVQYNRKAFIVKDTTTRFTLDSDVSSSESNFDLFSTELSLYPVMHEDDVLLEVKFSDFLQSYLRDILCLVGKTEISASKYCAARLIGKHRRGGDL